MASWQPYLCDTVTGQIETPIDLPAFSWSVSVSDSSLATLKEKGLGDETVSGLTVPWTSLPGDTPSARRRSISTDRTSVALLWKDADDDSLGRPILMGSIGVRQDKALDTSFTLNSPMAMLADRYVIREGKYGTGPNGTSPDVINPHWPVLQGHSKRGGLPVHLVQTGWRTAHRLDVQGGKGVKDPAIRLLGCAKPLMPGRTDENQQRHRRA